MMNKKSGGGEGTENPVASQRWRCCRSTLPGPISSKAENILPVLWHMHREYTYTPPIHIHTPLATQLNTERHRRSTHTNSTN